VCLCVVSWRDVFDEGDERECHPESNQESVVIKCTKFNAPQTEGILRRPAVFGCNFVFFAGFCLGGWGLYNEGSGKKRGRKPWRMDIGRCDVTVATVGERNVEWWGSQEG